MDKPEPLYHKSYYLSTLLTIVLVTDVSRGTCLKFMAIETCLNIDQNKIEEFAG